MSINKTAALFDLLQGAASVNDSFTRRRDGFKLSDNPGVSGASAQLRALSDPHGNMHAHMHNLRKDGQIVMGKIVDATSLANAYKVNVTNDGIKIGVALSSTSLGVYGAKDLNMYTLGTRVFGILHPDSEYFTILGAIPSPGGDPAAALHGILHGATRQRVDQCHRTPLEMMAPGSLATYTDRRLFDSVGGGETGWITETGLRIFLDPFMCMLGADEASNLTFFHHDRLVRLIARQWQLWTAVSETEAFNDNGEAQHWTGYAQYPWENIGELQPSGEPIEVNSGDTWRIEKPERGKTDLANPYAQPFHREREWHGYLGQGFKRTLTLPPQRAATYKEPEARGPQVLRGLADQFITLDGRMCFQSAKGISLTKRPIIVTPSRESKPEAPTGDNPKNYRASGMAGEGYEHIVASGPAIGTDGSKSTASRIAGLLDMHAYIYNFAGTHPFFYHAEDYSLPEETEISEVSAIPDYASLKQSFALDPEQNAETVTIDHRYGEQKIYGLPSGVELLEDGGVVIFDGAGSEVRLANGDITFSCPGNAWIKTGKNIINLAGFDIIQRAKNSVDITATNKDVRVKAQHNLQMQGGGDRRGGVLIESLSAGTEFDPTNAGEDLVQQGLILKAPQSHLVTISSTAYVRTVGGGPIILDADKGAGSLSMYGSSLKAYASSGVSFVFGASGESVAGPLYRFTQGGCDMPGELGIGGSLKVDGSGNFQSDVRVQQNILVGVKVSAKQITSNDISKGFSPPGAYPTPTVTDNQEQLKSSEESAFKSTFSEGSYQENKRGSDKLISDLSFCYRTDDQYKVEGFYMFEDRWQQIARITSQELGTWTESAVPFDGQNYYPYPGRANFEGRSLMQQTPTLIDSDTLASLPRNAKKKENPTRQEQEDYIPLAEAYAEPKFGTVEAVSLNQYIVLR